MLIVDKIKTAIQKAVDKAGNPYRFSLKLSGIRHTTIRDWLSGKTLSISDENWQKLYPEIKEYIYQGDIMTRLEKLQAIEKAYLALIPGLRNISVPDYELVLSKAPEYLKDFIAEETKKMSDLSDGSDQSDENTKEEF